MIRDECVGKNTVTSVGERAGDPALSREARIRSPDPRNTLEMPRIRYQIFVTHIGPPITLLAPSLFLPFSLTRPTSGSSPLRSAHVFRLYTACNIWAPCYLSYSLSRRSRMGCTLHSTGRPLTTLCLIALILPQRHKLSRESPSYTNYCFILLARSTFAPPFSGDRELLDRVSTLFSLYATHLPILSRSPTRRHVTQGMLIFERIAWIFSFCTNLGPNRPEPCRRSCVRGNVLVSRASANHSATSYPS